MPIQINGTTVIDEANFADKNLSNLSETGLAVITNAASSVGANYMKKINTKAGISTALFSSGNLNSYTIPSDGWVVINGELRSVSSDKTTLNFYANNGSTSMPVKAQTIISIVNNSNVLYVVFFPEVS